MTTKILVVTRHPALLALLRERRLISGDVEVKAHVSVEDVRGRHVIGVLPMHLASQADLITEVPLALAPEDRGQELSLDRLRQIAGPARTYSVRDLTAVAPNPGEDWETIG